MPAMDAQTHVIAKAVARQDISLDVDPTTTLRVHANGRLAPRFAFRIYETSQDEETWKFRLRTRIGDGPEQTAEKTHLDKRIGKDNLWGNIGTEHTIPGAGMHVLHYTLEGEISVRAWGDAAPPISVHRIEESGQITLDAS